MLSNLFLDEVSTITQVDIKQGAFGAIKEFFVWIYWWLMKGINTILTYIGRFFDLFTGQLISKNLGDGEYSATFFDNLFYLGENNSSILNVLKIYGYMMLIAVVVMVVLVIARIIREDYFSKEDPKSKAGIIRNMALSFLLFAFVAPFTLIALKVVNVVMSAVVTMLTASSGESINLVDHLNKAGFEAFSTNFSFSKDWIKLYPGNEGGGFLSNYFNNIGGLSNYNFHWLLLLLGGCFIGYNLLMLAVDLIKKLFNVIILYFIAPFEIASLVSDDGRRFHRWKDNIFKEVLGIFVIVSAFIVFKILVPISSSFEKVTIGSQEVAINNHLSNGDEEFITYIDGINNVGNEISSNKIGGALVIIFLMGASLAVRQASYLILDKQETSKSEDSSTPKTRTITRFIRTSTAKNEPTRITNNYQQNITNATTNVASTNPGSLTSKFNSGGSFTTSGGKFDLKN